MFRNYVKTAFRNLMQNKGYAVINICGLSVGMAAAILLFIVVRYELSYDTFQPNYDHIVHVVTQDKYPDGVEYNPGTPFPIVDALRIDFPQVKTGVLFASYGSQVSVVGSNDSPGRPEKKFIETSGIFFADPEFFQIFQFKWLAGAPSLLAEPNNTILTRDMAEKYFGNWKSAIGRFIRLDNALTLKVAGVLENVPANTDFPLRIVTSYITFRNSKLYGYTTDWGSTTSNEQVFMLLPPGLSKDNMDKQLLEFGKRHYDGIKRDRRRHFLQPLSEVHFDSRFGNFGDHITGKSTLWTLSLIGLFIIVMACINFINLSTAHAVNRSKEIGIRKVLGSKRTNLFWQMMGETGLIVLIALIVGVVLAEACLPFIKNIDSIDKPLTVFTPVTLVFLFGIGMTVTFLSGLYPSLIVSGFSPMLALKNKITSASIGGISLRRGLVIAQFAISQVLIIGTIVAISQMNFVRNADLGFDKDAVFVLNSNADSIVLSRQPAFKEALLQLPGVQSVSFSSDVPSSDNNWGTNFAFDHKPDENFTLYLKFGDEDYLKTYGLQLAAGRNYGKSDTIRDVLINETLVRKLGLKSPEDAIGKEIRLGGRSSQWKTIVGVVNDFKTNSLREETKPLVISTRSSYYSNTSIKMRSSNLAVTKDAILREWDQFYPEYAATSYFVDDSINNFYRQENQLSLLYKIFAGIAIFISCLGLYGLVSFMAVQRKKEVGIRKVLGASVQHIVYLFSKEFTLLIFIAFMVAAPIAWYMMSHWLQNFAYRIELSIGVFILAILLSVLIALITVGYKSLRAAIANPVKSLRTE